MPELALRYPLSSPTILAASLTSGIGLVLCLRRRPTGPAFLAAGAQISAIWAVTGIGLCFTQMCCGTTADHLLDNVKGLALAGTIPMLCAFLGRPGSRVLYLGVVLPWIDYTLLSLGWLALTVWGTGPRFWPGSLPLF